MRSPARAAYFASDGRSGLRRAIGAFSLAAAVMAFAMTAGTAALASGHCENQPLRVGPAALLPDCRAYEQVSPVEKGGFDAVSRVSLLAYPVQASPSGEAVAYMGSGSFAGAAGSGLPNAHLSRRGEEGWQTAELTPPTPQATYAGLAPLGYDFSEDLSQGILKVAKEALTSLPAGSEDLYNLFWRHSAGSYSLVNSGSPSTAPPSGCEPCFEALDAPAFAGASSSFDRILFEADDSIAGTGAPEGFFGNLYESASGVLRLVGILPDGSIAAGGAVAGAGGEFFGGVNYSSAATTALRDVNHAMSAEGTRVLFEASADGGLPDPAQSEMTELYDRIEGERTVEVSAPAAGAAPANTSPEPAQFWAASADGSLVFFTSSAELTTPSNTGSANASQDLYRYDERSGALTDLSVDTTPTDASTGAGVQGVVGASTDGSYVYFVATGQLVSGKGVDGQPNLYVSHENTETHESELSFIATLKEGDSHDWTSTPAELQAYVTPDGRHVAFMSLNNLTGYHNIDRNTGEPDSEVYEYSADSGSLVCASCDPSGAPPVGSAFIGATLHHLASTPFYQPRALSDDGGRLFFSSPDPLVGGTGSPHVKVYEHEQGGQGSCVTEGGCLSLISSGTSEVDDVFLDASASGNDVFFATLSRLAPTDQDNLVDVYDARVEGGFPVQTTPATCSVDCQSPVGGPAGAPPLLSDLTGASGNIPPSPEPSAAKRNTKLEKPSCQAKAKKIRSPKARAKALRRCPKPSRAKTKRRTGR